MFGVVNLVDHRDVKQFVGVVVMCGVVLDVLFIMLRLLESLIGKDIGF